LYYLGFTQYTPLHDATIHGLGSHPITAQGHGIVIVNFNVIWHTLQEVLHTPNAKNCLLSISHFDVGGGDIQFKDGKAILQDKSDWTLGIGRVKNRLYLLDVQAELPGQERANFASTQKLLWDQIWTSVGRCIGNPQEAETGEGTYDQ
jgi:hypothetical protein